MGTCAAKPLEPGLAAQVTKAVAPLEQAAKSMQVQLHDMSGGKATAGACEHQADHCITAAGGVTPIADERVSAATSSNGDCMNVASMKQQEPDGGQGINVEASAALATPLQCGDAAACCPGVLAPDGSERLTGPAQEAARDAGHMTHNTITAAEFLLLLHTESPPPVGQTWSMRRPGTEPPRATPPSQDAATAAHGAGLSPELTHAPAAAANELRPESVSAQMDMLRTWAMQLAAKRAAAGPDPLPAYLASKSTYQRGGGKPGTAPAHACILASSGKSASTFNNEQSSGVVMGCASIDSSRSCSEHTTGTEPVTPSHIQLTHPASPQTVFPGRGQDVNAVDAVAHVCKGTQLEAGTGALRASALDTHS